MRRAALAGLVTPGLAAAVTFVLAIGLVALGAARGVDPGDVLRDPAGVYGLSVMAGAASYLGVALLGATAAVTGFAASLGRGRTRILASVAVLSAILAVDDLFLLHERILPDHAGLPEEALYVAYVLAAAAIGLALLRRPDARHFGLAVPAILLSAAIFADLALTDLPGSIFIEDLPKVAGLGAWCAFWVAFARREAVAPAGV